APRPPHSFPTRRSSDLPVRQGGGQGPVLGDAGPDLRGLLARSLGLLALAAGGVLFVLALLGLLDGGLAGVAGPLGAGVFLTVLAYAALRTRSHLHGVVLAIVGALLVYTGVAAARG